MLNQKKVEIFLVKFRKPPTKQFLEVAFRIWLLAFWHIDSNNQIIIYSIWIMEYIFLISELILCLAND